MVIRLRKEGCSYRSIRNQTGLGQATIRRIIVDQSSIELPIKRELVLRLHSEGLSNTQIHRETDIGLMLISKIIEEQEVMA